MSNFVTYKDFNKDNLASASFEEGKSKTGTIKFKTCKIFYNYGTPDAPVVHEFLLEGPVLHSGRGLSDKTSEDGKVSHKITSALDNRNADHTEYDRVLDEVHAWCAQVLSQNATKLGNAALKNPDAAKGMLRGLSFMPTDGNSGKLVSHNCFDYGTAKTTFTTPEMDKHNKVQPKVLPWSYVRNAEFDYIPLTKVRDIFAGTQLTIRSTLQSAVVFNLKPAGSSTVQLSTLERLVQANPDMVNDIQEQIASLASANQGMLEDQLPAPKAPQTVKPQPAKLASPPTDPLSADDDVPDTSAPTDVASFMASHTPAKPAAGKAFRLALPNTKGTLS
jgi:hypothetical protein